MLIDNKAVRHHGVVKRMPSKFKEKSFIGLKGKEFEKSGDLKFI